MAFFRDVKLCVIILFLNYVALVVSNRSVPVQTVEAFTNVPDATEIDQAGKEVEPVYANGVEVVGEVTDGPSTTTVKINTPKFVLELSVRAIPVSPDTVLVTVDAVGGDLVDKLRISYSDDLTINWARVDDYNSKENYALVAGLQPSTKYFFNVSATVSNETRSVVTHVLTPPAVPELSVRAIPVSPDTVLVTVDIVGGDKVDKLRILYSDDSAIKWTRVDDYNSKENYALVARLQPSTKYFFNVSATVNNEERSVVTHVLTPPADPELSVRAIPVSPDTVLVTVDAVGGDNVDKLRILYSDDSAVKWTRVDDYNSKENYALAVGLQPSTKYFFNVSATVNNEARSMVTHVLTPPAGFSTPTNISVTAKTDSSVLLTWNYDGDVTSKGFNILIENLQPDGSVRPVKQNVVFKQNEAVVDGLVSGEKYQVKVEPFELGNNGTCSDPVLFQLNVAGETTTPEQPRQSDYKVVLKEVKQSPTEVKVKWAVNEGNLKHIRYFDVKLVTHRGRVVLNRRRKPTVRSETFRRLKPQKKYIVNVQTVTARGVVDNSSVEIISSAPNSNNRKHVLYLDIVEVRDNTAMVEFSSHNLDLQQVLLYRVRVKDLDNTALGDIILNKKSFIPDTPFILESLKPNRNYQVIIDALSKRGSGLLTAIANFSTSAPGKYGTPVFTSSETSPQVTPDVPTSPTLRPTTIFTRRPPPTVPQSTPTTRRTPPTVPSRTFLTTEAIEETTTGEPFVIVTTELSKSQISEQVSYQGKNDTSNDPVLEFRVNPVDISLISLTWSTQNMPAGLDVVYIVRVRKDGPEGKIGVNQKYSITPETNLTLEIGSFIIHRPYFLELDAVFPNGSVIVSASTLYIPGIDVTPFHVTSKLSDSGLSQLQSREGGSQVDDNDGSKPGIDLELNPLAHNQIRINWTVINENRRRPVAFYKVKVHQDGPEGHKLHEYLVYKNTLHYTVSELFENKLYYIQLDALDKDGRVIEYVGYPYLVPPPGHAVEPSRTPSVFNKNKVTTTVSPAKQDRVSEREELVISRVEVQGSNSILVEWNHAQADASKYTRGTLVRYQKYTGNVHDSPWAQFAPAGQQRLIIRGLKPDTIYGIQVVPDGSDGWSKTVFGQTGPV